MTVVNPLDIERECELCGATIPAGYRHFTPPQSVNVCLLQDMRTLRYSGICETCGVPAFRLHRREVGEIHGHFIEGSERHYDVADDADHDITVVPGPLASVVSDFIDREQART